MVCTPVTYSSANSCRFRESVCSGKRLIRGMTAVLWCYAKICVSLHLGAPELQCILCVMLLIKQCSSGVQHQRCNGMERPADEHSGPAPW